MLRYKEITLSYLGWMMCLIVMCSYSYYASIHEIHPGDRNFYSKLGNAFLSGHTYLADQPSSKLLKAENPYDRSLRQYGMWDASYYQGKYYLYFGAVPALLPWIPVKLLFGADVGDRGLCLIFCCMGALSLVWLLVAMSWRGQLPLSAAFFGALAVAFGTWIPLMLRRPSFYEVAIAGAFCYAAVGLCCLWYALQQPDKHAHKWKLLSGLFLGLSVGCRLFYVWAVIIPAVVWLVSFYRGNVRQALKDGFLLIALWFFCIACIGLYNYVRFDSVFESGIRYQLSRGNWYDNVFNLWGAKQFWNNLYTYLLSPVPWQRLWHGYAAFGLINSEQPFGVVTNSPLTLLILAALPMIILRRQWGVFDGLYAGIAVFAVGLTLFMSFHKTMANRYSVDFAPWYMLVAVFSYAYLLNAVPEMRRVMVAFAAIAVTVTVYIGLANPYCGYYSC